MRAQRKKSEIKGSRSLIRELRELQKESEKFIGEKTL